MTQWPVRVVAIALVIASAWYVSWAARVINGSALWLSVPFVVANAYSVVYSLVVVFNQWNRQIPARRRLPYGSEPVVGVIIPTCGEPVPMILRTILSVLEQDWPADKLEVVVSDDGHDASLANAVRDLPVHYFEPPDRWAPGRDGAAKAGNLNAAYEHLVTLRPSIRYVETRDADDEVGSTQFLRHTVGQLAADRRLGFVQTIKEAQVSAGDPFNNRESMFYRGQMLTRNAANAVFPCGSGVVWRRKALIDIGGFPVWNLVEDLQSGVEALRRGWRGLYLPIVGAVGQHSPEDLPNAYKQRGTWALDTIRLMVWGDLRGLNRRQKLHFYGMVLDYFNGFTALIYVPAIAVSFLGVTPFATTGWAYAAHVVPLAVATEAWLLIINRPFNDRRTKQRHPYRTLWRARVIWTGMAPIYMRAAAQALVSGPNRKPVYRVTRKHDDHRWHWQLTVPQAFTVTATAAVPIYSAVHDTLPPLPVLLATTYWGGLHLILFTRFVMHGWHGVGLLRRRVATSLPATEPALA